MARYLTVTPKYNPISIDEYLKVPMLLAKEYQEEEEKVESYKDKMSYIRSLMGDKGSKYLQQYDDLMNSISDDPSVANMTRVGKQLREIYRDVSSKADIAKTNRDRYQAMFDKDPSLIGDIGAFDKYYEDPNYKPSMISGSQLQKDIGIWAAQQKQAQVPTVKGVMPGDESKLIVEQGYTPDQLNGFIADATSGNPQTKQGQELASILEQHGYNSASENDKARLAQYITGGLANASSAISTTANPEYMNASQWISYKRNKLAYEQEHSNFEKYGNTGGSSANGWTTLFDNTGAEHRFKFSGKETLIEKWNATNKTWEPATSFTDSSGRVYKMTSPGHFEEKVGATASKQGTPTSYFVRSADDPKKGVPIKYSQIEENKERFLTEDTLPTDDSSKSKKIRKKFAEYSNSDRPKDSEVVYDKDEGTYYILVPYYPTLNLQSQQPTYTSWNPLRQRKETVSAADTTSSVQP